MLCQGCETLLRRHFQQTMEEGAGVRPTREAMHPLSRCRQRRQSQQRIFIVDGNVWTSAGMTAVIDLALAMIEQDLGPEVARGVAKSLVVYHRRAGGQSQFSALSKLKPKSDRIQQALTYAKSHLRRPLSVDELAEAANLSTRQFSRSFRLETGQSPARAIEVLRVEAARAMIETSNHSIDVVARETGLSGRNARIDCRVRIASSASPASSAS